MDLKKEVGNSQTWSQSLSTFFEDSKLDEEYLRSYKEILIKDKEIMKSEGSQVIIKDIDLALDESIHNSPLEIKSIDTSIIDKDLSEIDF